LVDECQKTGAAAVASHSQASGSSLHTRPYH
jgi:hypothetical protein